MILVLLALFGAAAIGGLIISIINVNKPMRIYIIAINCVFLLLWGSIAVLNKVDIDAEDEESYEYVITKGDGLHDIYYEGEIDGYQCIKTGGLFSVDRYVVPREMVLLSNFCKVNKTVKIYSKRNESFYGNGSDSLVKLSNGSEAYYTENIVKIKPDYRNLVLFSGIFGGIGLGIHNIVFAIICLSRKKKAKKQNIV